MKIHVVQKGDTLWDIANQYNVSYEELLQMNAHISSPDMIMPGMKIRVPLASKSVKTEHVETSDSQNKKSYHDIPQKAKPVIEEDDHEKPKHVKAETPWQSPVAKPNLDTQQMPQPQHYPGLKQEDTYEKPKSQPEKEMPVPPKQGPDQVHMKQQPMYQQHQSYKSFGMQGNVCMCCGQSLVNVNQPCMMSQQPMAPMPPPMPGPIQGTMDCVPQSSGGIHTMPWGGHHMAQPGSGNAFGPYDYRSPSTIGQMPSQGIPPMMDGKGADQGFQPMHPIQPMQSMHPQQMHPQQMMMPSAYPHGVEQGNMPTAPYPAPPYLDKGQEQTGDTSANNDS